MIISQLNGELRSPSTWTIRASGFKVSNELIKALIILTKFMAKGIEGLSLLS